MALTLEEFQEKYSGIYQAVFDKGYEKGIGVGQIMGENETEACLQADENEPTSKKKELEAATLAAWNGDKCSVRNNLGN